MKTIAQNGNKKLWRGADGTYFVDKITKSIGKTLGVFDCLENALLLLNK